MDFCPLISMGNSEILPLLYVRRGGMEYIKKTIQDNMKRKKQNHRSDSGWPYVSWISCYSAFQKLAHASDYTSSDLWSFGNAEFATKYHKLKILIEGWWIFLITFSVTDKLSSEEQKILCWEVLSEMFIGNAVQVFCIPVLIVSTVRLSQTREPNNQARQKSGCIADFLFCLNRLLQRGQGHKAPKTYYSAS